MPDGTVLVTNITNGAAMALGLAIIGYLVTAVKWGLTVNKSIAILTERLNHLLSTLDGFAEKMEEYMELTTKVSIIIGRVDDHENRIREVEKKCPIRIIGTSQRVRSGKKTGSDDVDCLDLRDE